MEPTDEDKDEVLQNAASLFRASELRVFENLRVCTVKKRNATAPAQEFLFFLKPNSCIDEHLLFYMNLLLSDINLNLPRWKTPFATVITIVVLCFLLSSFLN